jgi:hypothetical protein
MVARHRPVRDTIRYSVLDAPGHTQGNGDLLKVGSKVTTLHHEAPSTEVNAENGSNKSK